MLTLMKKIPSCMGVMLLFSAPLAAAAPTHSLEVLSPVYKIDRIYKSMEGPQSSKPVYLMDSQPPELLWITGFKTEMVQADGTTPTLPEFMCHVNLDYNVAEHNKLFGEALNGSSRLLTLSQGQVSARFPDGFGMPILSNEPLSLTTQVLNFNLEKPRMEVRHKVTFYFVRDRDLQDPLKPLFNAGAFGMKLIEGRDGHYGMPEGQAGEHGPSCLPGTTAPNASGGSVYADAQGRKFSGHWVVKPGREVNHTNVTRYMNLPFDKTLHYIAVHLHPFAESLELRDLTMNKRIFKSRARGFRRKIGLSEVDHFSSPKGVPMYKNHDYELVSVYKNTTKVDQDSMAVMLLFLLDKDFKKPNPANRPAGQSGVQATPAPVAERSAPLAIPKGTRIVLHTLAGDLLLSLFPNAAPKTVAHVLDLVKAGAYDTTHFYRVEPGFVVQTSLGGE